MNILKELISLNEKLVKDDEYFICQDAKTSTIDLYTEKAYKSFEAAHAALDRFKKEAEEIDSGAGDEDFDLLDSCFVVSGKFLKKNYPKLFEAAGEKLEALKKLHARAKKISKEQGVVQHINREKRTNNMYVSDWFDSDETVASYESGRNTFGKDLSESADLAKQLVRGEKGPKGIFAKLDHWLSKLMIEKDGNRFLPADRAVKALESYGFSGNQVHKIREAAAEAAQTAIARMQKKHGERVPANYISKMGSSFNVFDLYLNVSESIHKEFAALMRQLFDAKIDKIKDELNIVKEEAMNGMKLYNKILNALPEGDRASFKRFVDRLYSKTEPEPLTDDEIDAEMEAWAKKRKLNLNEARSIPSWFQDGAKVKLMPEYADKDPDEVFTLQSVDDDGRGRVADEQGRGWNIRYYQVYPKNKTPAIHEGIDGNQTFTKKDDGKEGKYGVKVGQIYVPADGSKNELKVLSINHAAEDALVFDKAQGKEHHIDLFKLAKVRYSLKEDTELQSLGKKLGGKAADEPTNGVPAEEPSDKNEPSAEMPVEDESEAEVPAFKVNDKVKSLSGPHKGEVHTVVKVLPNGTLDITLDGADTTTVKYTKGGANARPDQVQLAESLRKGPLLKQIAEAATPKLPKTLDALQARKKVVTDKLDAIVQAGGRIMLNDPLQVEFMALRREIARLKKLSEGKNDTMMPLSYRPAKGHKIEAYGRKGMKNTMWRKYFKDSAALEKWCEDNDATVEGSRDLDKDEMR